MRRSRNYHAMVLRTLILKPNEEHQETILWRSVCRSKQSSIESTLKNIFISARVIISYISKYNGYNKYKEGKGEESNNLLEEHQKGLINIYGSII